MLTLGGALTILRKKRQPKIAVRKLISLAISALDWDTLQQLTRLWIYFNGKRYEFENEQPKFRLIPRGSYTLRVYALPTEENPYFYVPEDFELQSGIITGSTFRLKMQCRNEQGDPLPNASVLIEYNSSTNQYTTDENGFVEISDLPCGIDITITIEKDEYKQKIVLRYD